MFEWDPKKTFSENMSTILSGALVSGTFGAGGAFVFSSTLQIAGGRRLLRRKDMAIPTHGGPHEQLVPESDIAPVRPSDAPAPNRKAKDAQTLELHRDDLATSTEFKKVGDYYVDKDGLVYETVSEGADGNVTLVRDEHAAIAVREEVADKTARAAADSTAPDAADTITDMKVPGKHRRMSHTSSRRYWITPTFPMAKELSL